VVASFCPIYTIVAAAVVAPKGWLAKFLLLPAIALLIIALMLLEALTMSICSIGGLGAVFILYINLLLGGVAVVTFLALRIAGLFVVDSIFGAERLDKRFKTWLGKGDRMKSTKAETTGRHAMRDRQKGGAKT
jgi:hypothetical protein